MNWRRGLFRLWIVGATLFVISVAFISYPKIKAEFDDAATIAAILNKTAPPLVSGRTYTDAEVGRCPPVRC